MTSEASDHPKPDSKNSDMPRQNVEQPGESARLAAEALRAELEARKAVSASISSEKDEENGEAGSL